MPTHEESRSNDVLWLIRRKKAHKLIVSKNLFNFISQSKNVDPEFEFKIVSVYAVILPPRPKRKSDAPHWLYLERSNSYYTPQVRANFEIRKLMLRQTSNQRAPGAWLLASIDLIESNLCNTAEYVGCTLDRLNLKTQTKMLKEYV